MTTTGPLNLNLQAFSDADFRETVEVILDGTPQDWAGWTNFELLVANTVFATAPLIIGTVTPQAGGILSLAIARADLAACFPAGKTQATKSYPYVLRAMPTGSYRVRLMYGMLELQKGLP